MPPAAAVRRGGRRPVRVGLVDHEAGYRHALARLLSRDTRVEVVAEVDDDASGVDELLASRPEVILLDLGTGGGQADDPIRDLLRRAGGAKLLILSKLDADRRILSALRSGVSGYVLKDSPVSSIAASVVAVRDGELVIGEPVAGRVVGMLPPDRSEQVRPRLSPRQTEIIRQIAVGASTREIAAQLSISEKTVRNQVSLIYAKLRIRDRAQAGVYAIRHGLVEHV